MNSIQKAFRILREEGLAKLVKKTFIYLYNHYLCQLLPRRIAIYNGVEVKAARLFDSLLPWRRRDRPNYESGLVSAINSYVREGDNVVIVGGGWGVTAVKAAQMAGISGKITVHEASYRETKKVEETIGRNKVSDRVSVNHTLVGPSISLRGDPEQPTKVSPDELPECDVLELDCEGAETVILKNIGIKPRLILVESHGKNGSSSEDIKKILRDKSYTIQSETIADRGNEEFCIENDILVITAIKK